MSVPIAAGLPILKELITAATQYQMCREHELTERMKIEAQLETCLERLNRDHEKFMRAMDVNSGVLARAYDMVERLLNDERFNTNPHLLQLVLNFLQFAHATHSANFIAVVNGF